MSRGPDAATLLDRALQRSAAAAGVTLSVREADWRRWASATFTGARHALLLDVADGPEARAWLDHLPEIDLPMRGHLVADIVITGLTAEGASARVEVEALTVEDA